MVDTNVAVVANQTNSEPLACIAACASALHGITRTGLVVIDDAELILREYKYYLSFKGQPGAGDRFFKWLVNNRGRRDRVVQVTLAEDPKRPGEFATFPADSDLEAFDRSDRKFVAAALAHPEKPPVLNASDSDWWVYRHALKRHGVTIQFVCGEERFQGKTAR